MEHEQGDPVGTSLGQLLLAGDRLRAVVAARSGLSPVESVALSHLYLAGPLTQRGLGERVGLSTGAVTGLVDRLERHGSCRREPHPTDRRSSYVVLTERGREVVEQTSEPLSSVGAAVPQDRRGELAGDLQVLADTMAATVHRLAG